MNQSDLPTSNPRALRRIKLTPKALPSIAFAATRRTELPSGSQSVTKRKRKGVVRRRLSSSAGPPVDCEQTQAQVQEDGSKDKEGKKSEEVAHPIRAQDVDTTMCSDFDNGPVERTRQGSSQATELTSQVAESLPVPSSEHPAVVTSSGIQYGNDSSSHHVQPAIMQGTLEDRLPVAHPIRVQGIDTTVCSNFDNGPVEGARQGSSQATEFTSQVAESRPVPSSEHPAVVTSSGIQYGNEWMNELKDVIRENHGSSHHVQPAIMQGTLEDKLPVNAYQLLSPMTDTTHPQPLAAFSAGFFKNWTRLTTLTNRIHQDFGKSFIIAAQRDLLHGDDNIILHATEGLDWRKFLERLEACIPYSKSSSNSDTVNDVVTEKRVQSSEEAEVLGTTKTKTDVDAQILNELKDLLTKSAREAGLNILAKNGRLMWATVEDIMAEEHVYLDNYPYILMPHDKRQQKWKGIQNLRKAERKELIKALRSQVNRCQFIKLPKVQRGDIDSSKHPLIIFAPPPADSPHEKGLRYFRNGLRDWRGHPRTISTSNDHSDENGLAGKQFAVYTKGLSSKSKTYNRKSRILQMEADFTRESSESDVSSGEERAVHGTHLKMKSSKKRRADSDSEEEILRAKQSKQNRCRHGSRTSPGLVPTIRSRDKDEVEVPAALKPSVHLDPGKRKKTSSNCDAGLGDGDRASKRRFQQPRGGSSAQVKPPSSEQKWGGVDTELEGFKQLNALEGWGNLRGFNTNTNGLYSLNSFCHPFVTPFSQGPGFFYTPYDSSHLTQ